MERYICTKSANSNFACSCEKCFQDFMESLDKTCLVSENKMRIYREWSMPNKKTFTIKPIKELLERVMPAYQNSDICLDPFPFEYSKDATDYLNEKQDDCYYNAVFDPPYSPRQLKEVYKGKGEYDTKASTWSNWKDLLSKKIKKGGIVISFGWSSQGMGKNRGFKIEEILLVAHGGNHNDTICVVERKIE